MRKMTNIIACALAMAAGACQAAWDIVETTDAMTDERSYTLITRSEKLVTIQPYVQYFAGLNIRITPKRIEAGDKVISKQELYFTIDTEGLKRSGVEVQLRLDKGEPVWETWDPSTDRRAAFSPKANSTIGKLVQAQRLTLRYSTTLGDIRTVCFPLDGLREALRETKKRILAHGVHDK